MTAPTENIIDASTGLPVLWKHPDENKLFDMDMEPEMRAGDTLSAATNPATSTNLGNVTGSANVSLGVPTHNSAQKLQVRISGGTDLEDYRIKIEGTTAGGDTVIGEGILRVRNDPVDV